MAFQTAREHTSSIEVAQIEQKCGRKTVLFECRLHKSDRSQHDTQYATYIANTCDIACRGVVVSVRVAPTPAQFKLTVFLGWKRTNRPNSFQGGFHLRYIYHQERMNPQPPVQCLFAERPSAKFHPRQSEWISVSGRTRTTFQFSTGCDYAHKQRGLVVMVVPFA